MIADCGGGAALPAEDSASTVNTRMLPLLQAGRISPAYWKPHTCRQRHAALTGGMTYSEPAAVNLYLVSLLPLAGPRAAWA